MASVPLSVAQLEKIVEIVATDLLEEWALNDRFSEEDLENAKKNALNDSIFVIDTFMSLFNETMSAEAEQKRLI